MTSAYTVWSVKSMNLFITGTCTPYDRVEQTVLVGYRIISMTCRRTMISHNYVHWHLLPPCSLFLGSELLLLSLVDHLHQESYLLLFCVLVPVAIPLLTPLVKLLRSDATGSLAKAQLLTSLSSQGIVSSKSYDTNLTLAHMGPLFKVARAVWQT